VAGIGEGGTTESAGRGEVPSDVPPKAGVFPDGLTLLKAIDASGYRFDEIGVPSYPEGHPHIDDDTLWSTLLSKQYYATYTVTQMCFDADMIRRFATDARGQGITLPIIAGVPGAVTAGKLLRVSFRIGVGDSVRFVRRHRTLARRLLRPHGYSPDGLLRKLVAAITDDDATARRDSRGRTRRRPRGSGSPLVAGLHIYTFNEIAPTARWLEQRRRSLDPGEEVAADDHAV
jgi:methylenetetrahydrofolate reductase (NADPH)